MTRPAAAFVALTVAAFLYGSTFVVIKDAVTRLDPLPFVGWRFLIGAAVLLLLARPRRLALWRDGILAGGFVFAGFALQTQGLTVTSATNSALITGLYVVLTPLVASIVGRAAPRLATLAGALLAFGGLAVLILASPGAGFEPTGGDLLTVGAAAAFAIHIVVLAAVAPRHPVVPLTAVQLLVTGVLALALSLPTGTFALPAPDDAPALLLTGLAVSVLAFLLQVWAQTVVGPARAAVILVTEPVFAAIVGAAAGERLSAAAWAGAGLILLGIVAVIRSTPATEPTVPAEAVTPAH